MSSVRRSGLPITSAALFLGGLLWIASFWLPIFITPDRVVPGYWVFVTGWMGFSVFQFAWYANLLIFLAVILMYTYPLRATLIAGLAVLVATQAFWFDVIPGSTKGMDIVQHGLGFWFWYASILLMGLGVVFGSDDVEPDARTDGRRSRKAEQAQTGAAPVLGKGKVEPVVEGGGAWPEAAKRVSQPGLLTENWPAHLSLVVSPSLADSGSEGMEGSDDLALGDDDIQFFTGKKKADTGSAPSSSNPW